MFSKQLDFESAATYYPYLLEEYFVRRRNDKMSEEIVFKWFINSYAKACKFIFEEKFSEAEKVVRQNIVSWRRMMNEMKKLKLEKYTSILNDLSDRLLKIIYIRDFKECLNIILHDPFISPLFMDFYLDLIKMRKNPYVLLEKYSISRRGLDNIIYLLRDKIGLRKETKVLDKDKVIVETRVVNKTVVKTISQNKYREYLERLERLKNDGKISQKVYERLKKKYLELLGMTKNENVYGNTKSI